MSTSTSPMPSSLVRTAPMNTTSSSHVDKLGYIRGRCSNGSPAAHHGNQSCTSPPSSSSPRSRVSSTSSLCSLSWLAHAQTEADDPYDDVFQSNTQGTSSVGKSRSKRVAQRRSRGLQQQQQKGRYPRASQMGRRSDSWRSPLSSPIPSRRSITPEDILSHDWATDTSTKPPFAYATIIFMALRESDSDKLSLAEIYDYVLENFAYYRTAKCGWKNSIRHNLSQEKYFERVDRDGNERGKGGYWALNPDVVDFDELVTRRRRKFKKPRHQEHQKHKFGDQHQQHRRGRCNDNVRRASLVKDDALLLDSVRGSTTPQTSDGLVADDHDSPCLIAQCEHQVQQQLLDSMNGLSCSEKKAGGLSLSLLPTASCGSTTPQFASPVMYQKQPMAPSPLASSSWGLSASMSLRRGLFESAASLLMASRGLSTASANRGLSSPHVPLGLGAPFLSPSSSLSFNNNAMHNISVSLSKTPRTTDECQVFFAKEDSPSELGSIASTSASSFSSMQAVDSRQRLGAVEKRDVRAYVAMDNGYGDVDDDEEDDRPIPADWCV